MTNDLEDKLDSILYEFDSHNPDVYSAKQQMGITRPLQSYYF